MRRLRSYAVAQALHERLLQLRDLLLVQQLRRRHYPILPQGVKVVCSFELQYIEIYIDAIFYILNDSQNKLPFPVDGMGAYGAAIDCLRRHQALSRSFVSV